LQDEEVARKIPLFEENFDVTKRTEVTHLILVKKVIISALLYDS
jgi:stress response protein YsnF